MQTFICTFRGNIIQKVIFLRKIVLKLEEARKIDRVSKKEKKDIRFKYPDFS